MIIVLCAVDGKLLPYVKAFREKFLRNYISVDDELCFQANDNSVLQYLHTQMLLSINHVILIGD